MTFVKKTPDSVFDDFVDGVVERLIKAMINLLEYIGEMCLTEARFGGNYKDRTGNLRNSIGYIIVQDGKIIRENGFDSGMSKTADGRRINPGKEARKFAREKAREFPEGLVLIMVAGMNYSSYVAAKGYNVIDSAEDTAERLVPQMMKELGFEIAA